MTICNHVSQRRALTESASLHLLCHSNNLMNISLLWCEDWKRARGWSWSRLKRVIIFSVVWFYSEQCLVWQRVKLNLVCHWSGKWHVTIQFRNQSTLKLRKCAIFRPSSLYSFCPWRGFCVCACVCFHLSWEDFSFLHFVDDTLESLPEIAAETNYKCKVPQSACCAGQTYLFAIIPQPQPEWSLRGWQLGKR